MPTFLMKCPSCGKHFDVERTGDRVEKEIVMEDKSRELMTEKIGPVYSPSVTDDIDETVDEQVPVEVKTYKETYTCKHCGYTWTEER